MNTKTIIVLLLCTALLLLPASLAASNIKVTFLNQDPDPVDANKNVDVRFKVENLGNAAANNVVFELLTSYPFSLDGGTASRQLGTLAAFQKGEDAAIIKYTLRTDKNAADGESSIKVRYQTDGGAWVEQTNELSVKANTQDAYVRISEASVTPALSAPGKTAHLSLTIENLDDATIKDILVKLDLFDSSVPFAPTTEGVERRIASLDSKKKANLGYNLLVFATAATGTYKIPVNISYTDYDANRYVKEDLISIVVGSAPDLRFWVDSEDLYAKGSTITVPVKFVNKGIADAQFLYVELGASDDYEILSPKQVYLGKVDSDDYETAEYKIKISADVADTLKLPLSITYLDENNKEYVIDEFLPVQVYGADRLKELKPPSRGGTSTVVMIVIVVIVLYLGYRIFFRRKKKK